MICPTVLRGLSDENGSWKMICISRRRACIWFREFPRMLRPWKKISPAVGSSSRRMVRPKVVLPQPDSPTRPSGFPASMVRLTPSTALTDATCRISTPPRIG